ncbi:MAG: NAD(P)H-dependent glycerol-3-phosphate dehydrogenase [Myxococcota bacterium]
MARFVILGAGMMGTAFAWPLVDRGHEVRLVGTHLDVELVESMRTHAIHPKLGLALPNGVQPFLNDELPQALKGADAIVLGVSSAGVVWAAERLAPLLSRPLPLAMISKGLTFQDGALHTLPDVFSAHLPAALQQGIAPVGVAGPCIAGELARRVPTSVVFTSRSLAAAEAFAKLCRGEYYHVWCADDVVGVEVCAALKNAYAMGIALAAGMHSARGGKEGSIALHNYEASVFAQSIWEMRRLISLLGANPDHASWLPGVGDLDVTCNGGRTGRFGQLLGQGLGRDEAVLRMHGATLECLEILATLRTALNAFTATGRVSAEDFPLARHLAEVALDSAHVNMPFERFFRTSF